MSAIALSCGLNGPGMALPVDVPPAPIIDVLTDGGTIEVVASGGLLEITVLAPADFAGTYSVDADTVAEGPVNLVPPALVQDGSPAPGSTLGLTPGLWIYEAGQPAPLRAYQWRRDGVDITGATGQIRLLDAADAGAAVSVAEILTDTNGARLAVSAAVPVAMPASLSVTRASEGTHAGGGNQASVTFPAMNLSGSGDLFLIAAGFVNGAGTFSASVGGQDCSLEAEAVDFDGSVALPCAIFRVPTDPGAVGDVILAHTGQFNNGRCGCILVRAGGATITSDIAVGVGMPTIGLGVDTAAGGVVLATAVQNGATGLAPHVWSGATRLGADIDFDTGELISVALAETPIAASPWAIDVQAGSGFVRHSAIAIALS